MQEAGARLGTGICITWAIPGGGPRPGPEEGTCVGLPCPSELARSIPRISEYGSYTPFPTIYCFLQFLHTLSFRSYISIPIDPTYLFLKIPHSPTYRFLPLFIDPTYLFLRSCISLPTDLTASCSSYTLSYRSYIPLPTDFYHFLQILHFPSYRSYTVLPTVHTHSSLQIKYSEKVGVSRYCEVSAKERSADPALGLRPSCSKVK